MDLIELLEALLEDWVVKGIGHDLVATGLVEANLHLENADLVLSGHEEVQYDTCFLRTSCQIWIVFHSLLEVLGIVSLLSDIKVGTNLFLKGLIENLAWAIDNRTTEYSNNSLSSARATSRL
jgi:hypothetical protein